MDFSQAWHHSGLYSVSPDSSSIAIIQDTEVLIVDVHNFMEKHVFDFKHKVNHFEWSSNSSSVLCANYADSVVKTWSTVYSGWTCTIRESPVCGLVNARWAPDGNHIITISDFQLRLTVWSTTSSDCFQFDWPKHPSRGLGFSPDNHSMALATRHQGKDEVIIVSCESWQIMQSISVETTDLADLAWSPDNCSFAVWESPATDCKILVYSPDGRCLFKFQPYGLGLGIRTVAWSHDGHFLAIGSIADQAIRLVQTLTWKNVAKLSHGSTLEASMEVDVYKEIGGVLAVSDELSNSENGISGFVHTEYELADLPMNLPNVKPMVDKPNPKQGVGILAWSFDNRFLLSRCETMLNSVWIWDTASMAPSVVLLHQQPIKHVVWNPISCQLAVCTGSGNLFIWSEDGASCVAIPPELSNLAVIDLRWSANGQFLVLSSKTFVCCAFMDMSSTVITSQHT